MNNAGKRIKGLLFGLLYIAVYYTVTIITQVVFVLWQRSSGNYTAAEVNVNLINGTYALGVISAIISIWIYMFIGKLRKKPLYKVVKEEKSALSVNVMSICMAAGMRFLVTVFYSYSQNVDILKESIDEASALSPQLTTTVQLLVAVFAITVMLPFFEEILFRGLVMGEYLEILRPWAAIVLQAALFGAAHMALFQSVFTFIVGIVLGVLYYKTQSIKTVTLCHGAFNLSVIFTHAPMNVRNALIYGASGLILVVCSLIYIIKHSKK